MNNENNFRSLLSKRQWRRILPVDDVETLHTLLGPGINATDDIPYTPGRARYVPYTQSEMLAEYDPAGHKINSQQFYPNIVRVVDEPEYDENGNPVLDANGEQLTKPMYYEEAVPRHAFAFQRIISAAHIYHATTNDVQHELSIDEPTEKQEQLFNRICDGWTRDKIEDRWYELFKARENVAEGAFVGHIAVDKNTGKKVKSFRVFSFENGDQLFPQYDSQGNLILFARLTKQYDEQARCIETLEVWDEKYITTYRRGDGSGNAVVNFVRGIFGLDGTWNMANRQNHGFPFVPVAYVRNDMGPGWWASQSNIEDYEFTFSQMAHNNQAYGNSILVMKSGSDSMPDITRGMDGTVKAIYMGKEDDAKFLEGQSASDSYMRQLDKLEEMIYRCSNIVKSPTDLKSGDTPATAIKLLFTPNMMQCASDLSDCSPALDKMWQIYAFAYGYCTEGESFLECQSLQVVNWAKEFVPQSESAITADIVALAGAKIISRETAAKRVPFYSMANEPRKIMEQEKEMQDQELTYEIETIKANSRYGSIGQGGGGTESHDKRDGDGDGIYDE